MGTGDRVRSSAEKLDIEGLPSSEDITTFLSELRLDHQLVARLRGFESLVLATVGYIDAALPIPEVDSPSFEKDGILFLSSWQRGKTITASGMKGAPWTLQNNMLIEIWGEQLYASILMFVRPLPGTETERPTVCSAFTREPWDLREAPLKETACLRPDEGDVVRYLTGICADWGDWSPIPGQEFFAGVDDSPAIAQQALLGLRGLVERKVVCIEQDARRERFIRIHETFLDLFEDEDPAVNSEGSIDN